MEDIVPEGIDSTDWIARGTITGSEAVDRIVRVARSAKIRGRAPALYAFNEVYFNANHTTACTAGGFSGKYQHQDRCGQE
jgi:hypothetical protein